MKPLPPAKRFDWSNLGMRLASAAVLMPIGVASVALGSRFHALLIVLAVIVVLLSREWAAMTAPKSKVRVPLALTAAILSAMLTANAGHFALAWGVGAIAAVMAAIVARGLSGRFTDAIFGVAYIGAPMLALMWLRGHPPGVPWTFLILTVAWAADSFAFIFGSIFKGPKLWPRISPNKTWSGFIGGLGSAVAIAVLLHHILPPYMPWSLPEYFLVPAPLPALATVALLGGMATMGGDLLESMLKRRFGVKDSGGLIPGHGGLLDRVDGLMFAILVVAVVRLIGRVGLGIGL